MQSVLAPCPCPPGTTRSSGAVEPSRCRIPSSLLMHFAPHRKWRRRHFAPQRSPFSRFLCARFVRLTPQRLRRNIPRRCSCARAANFGAHASLRRRHGSFPAALSPSTGASMASTSSASRATRWRAGPAAMSRTGERCGFCVLSRRRRRSCLLRCGGCARATRSRCWFSSARTAGSSARLGRAPSRTASRGTRC